MTYLRKHCRNDTEKMQMVALKFGMFRELARSSEEFAMKNAKKLKGKPLGGCARIHCVCVHRA